MIRIHLLSVYGRMYSLPLGLPVNMVAICEVRKLPRDVFTSLKQSFQLKQLSQLYGIEMKLLTSGLGSVQKTMPYSVEKNGLTSQW